MMNEKKILHWVVLGDIVCASIVTMIGFLTHYDELPGWRILTSLIPVLLGWGVFSPWFGNYRMENIRVPGRVWRVGLAAFLSAPFAAWIRGIWLGSAIQPIFIAVLGLTNALGFVIWRGVFAFFIKWVGEKWMRRH